MASTSNSKRRIGIIVVVCVIVVVIVVIALIAVHPWDASSSAGSAGGDGASADVAAEANSDLYVGDDGASGGTSGDAAAGESRDGAAAEAQSTMEPYWKDDVLTEPASIEGLTTAYAVADGSAGPDFLGVSNTNFDFVDGDLKSDEQYMGYSAESLMDISGAGIALWATSVNENPNPFYMNLFYNVVILGNTSMTQTSSTWL